MSKSAKNTNGWQDPDAYEFSAWKLGTPRGEHVRERRLQAVLGLLKEEQYLLDVGAGPATLSQNFPCHVVACDSSTPMLKRAKERVGDVVRCDAQYLPIRNASLDIAFESSCLYLVGNKNEMIGEMRRIAKERVILFESNRLSLRRLYDKYFKGLKMVPEHPSPSEVKKYMIQARLSPNMTMVGFSPMVGGSSIMQLWKPIETFVETCPGLRLLCGGILAYADLEKR
jgi:hypothetical protein